MDMFQAIRRIISIFFMAAAMVVALTISEQADAEQETGPADAVPATSIAQPRASIGKTTRLGDFAEAVATLSSKPISVHGYCGEYTSDRIMLSDLTDKFTFIGVKRGALDERAFERLKVLCTGEPLAITVEGSLAFDKYFNPFLTIGSFSEGSQDTAITVGHLKQSMEFQLGSVSEITGRADYSDTAEYVRIAPAAAPELSVFIALKMEKRRALAFIDDCYKRCPSLTVRIGRVEIDGYALEPRFYGVDFAR